MTAALYLAAAVATVATLFTITRRNAMHALLYLIVALLALALVFFLLGAPFAALLEIIVYAGAIIVLFVFVVMMLNLGETAVAQERAWMRGTTWIGPALLSAVLLVELVYLLAGGGRAPALAAAVDARAVGALLYGPYLLAVEIGSMLLLAGLVGAYRIGRRIEPGPARGRSVP